MSHQGKKCRWGRMACAAAAFVLVLLSAVPARAQLNGSHTLGDFGVQSGTQPAPGFYGALFYIHYGSDTVKDVDGNIVRFAPSFPSSIGLTAAAPMVWYVSKSKLFGANVGAMAVIPFANSALEAPAFSFARTADAGLADILIRPLDLGWHTTHADTAAGLEIYLPTGRYEAGANDNLGKGMWTYEPFVGTTVYFDEKRTVSLAATAYWEFHSAKEGPGVKVGQILTLEGGLGKSFLGGGLIVGGAYYAQWKLTKDEFPTVVPPGGAAITAQVPGKHRVYAFGPDVTMPVASKSKLFALINFRYFWETGARLKTEGQSAVVTATFPIPSVKLK